MGRAKFIYVTQEATILNDLFQIAETPYGKGLFASRDFTKYHLIAEVLGEVIDDDDYSSSYCIDLGGTFSLEPGEPFRYLNHSCEPNCCLVYDEDEAEPPARIWVETIRYIEAGDQLTIDYAWPANAAIPCGCGTRSCRGWIVDRAEVNLLKPTQHVSSKDFTKSTAAPVLPA
ncbi:SET domain-containing protein-lysine N-methyltransferase [Blastopirellula sp. J2-11]|uniref:SET domain-containing protein n=1 Tax=Blastopirellula sp. J2-11 TaxID=2943192 RepID=UPI0021C7D694|nr:SET domain-containing protein [Blastopirellula sp. J2-11]UUO09054.1 SET domain-containing protein-lysine N-methyltransferase [Blastopirellula sp. J2-11]